jgi:hypothetical protein
VTGYECNIRCPCAVAGYVRGEILNLFGEEIEVQTIGLCPEHVSKSQFELGCEFIHERRKTDAARRVRTKRERAAAGHVRRAGAGARGAKRARKRADGAGGGGRV